MNFYEHQDLARRQTKRLLIIFAIALMGLIVLTAYVVAGIGYMLGLHNARFDSYQTAQSIWSISAQVFDWQYLGLIAFGVLSVVFIASAFRMIQLSAGGKVVAEQLGGRLINANPRDVLEKRLLNVVEEMAIASGTSVPSIYLIDETGINAFAAGFQSADAVIGVTRGALENLDRDELQGVIAHEFSHILNGDMRLNLRLVAMVYGIIVIANTGRYLMYARSRSNRDRVKTLSIGIALMALGYLGIFFGNLVKAAISRQREFLADASAVQYTRSNAGIGGALKKIGGCLNVPSIRHEWQDKDVNEFSHMLFSQGLHFNFFNNWMATHPPLNERIKRIDPSWDGSFTAPARAPERTPITEAEAAFKSTSVSKFGLATVGGTSLNNNVDILGSVAGANAKARSFSRSGVLNTSNLSVDALVNAINHSGDPSAATIKKASNELNHLKAGFELLCEKIHEPYTARGLVFSMLLDSDSSVRQQQWANIKKNQSQQLLKQTAFVYCQLTLLQPTQPMMLLDLALPILKVLSDAQYKTFKIQLLALIKMDKKIEVREWALYHLVDHHCRPRGLIQWQSVSLKNCKPAVARLLSALANVGCVVDCEDNDAVAERPKKIFELVIDSDFDFTLPWYPPNALTTELLTQSLEQVRHLRPLQKPQLLKACAKIIQHDGIIDARELELITCIAKVIDCPLPYMNLAIYPKID
ncbi:MAG: Zn-dependent protease with chaperone function [Pseudohongiellaceae bacterium]|jgi:Zn-dependent protease with chaperone function